MITNTKLDFNHLKMNNITMRERSKEISQQELTPIQEITPETFKDFSSWDASELELGIVIVKHKELDQFDPEKPDSPSFYLKVDKKTGTVSIFDSLGGITRMSDFPVSGFQQGGISENTIDDPESITFRLKTGGSLLVRNDCLVDVTIGYVAKTTMQIGRYEKQSSTS